MARLRNRIVKAEFWTDGELLRWPRDKRTTYKGLWALAEDSGCLEDDPFTWKLMLWPSPVDSDITVGQLETWRDELIAAGKMIPYEAEGKTYLYLTKFHQHEHPRNPQRPDLPLPTWIVWEANETDARKGQYREVTEVVQALNNEPTSVPVLPCPAPPCPAPSRSYKPLSDKTSDPPSENGSGASSTSSSPSKQMAARPDQALEVFTYWQAVMNHPKAKFTPERRTQSRGSVEAGLQRRGPQEGDRRLSRHSAQPGAERCRDRL